MSVLWWCLVSLLRIILHCWFMYFTGTTPPHPSLLPLTSPHPPSESCKHTLGFQWRYVCALVMSGFLFLGSSCIDGLCTISLEPPENIAVFSEKTDVPHLPNQLCRSRSPNNKLLILSDLYRLANLVTFHPMVHEITCRQTLFGLILVD